MPSEHRYFSLNWPRFRIELETCVSARLPSDWWDVPPDSNRQTQSLGRRRSGCSYVQTFKKQCLASSEACVCSAACTVLSVMARNKLTPMVVDEFRRGVPVGFALVSSEDWHSWVNFLKFSFERADRSPTETATMSDGDKTIMNACRRGLDVERRLLCAFHMQQAVGRRLRSSGSTAGFQTAENQPRTSREPEKGCWSNRGDRYRPYQKIVPGDN